MTLQISHRGTIVTFTPLDDDARAWLDENVCDAFWYGEGLAVEPRYAGELAWGAQEDGLSLQGACGRAIEVRAAP